MNWKKTENYVQSFIDESSEPVLMHVIKAGHDDTFIVVFDDALAQRTGDVEIHSADSFLKKFKTKLN